MIGRSATPSKHTFGVFNQNLVMEYRHAQAVADGVNVNHDVYRIKTEATEDGAAVEAGYWLQVLDMPTRARRDWQLDDGRLRVRAPTSWTAVCLVPRDIEPAIMTKHVYRITVNRDLVIQTTWLSHFAARAMCGRN